MALMWRESGPGGVAALSAPSSLAPLAALAVLACRVRRRQRVPLDRFARTVRSQPAQPRRRPSRRRQMVSFKRTIRPAWSLSPHNQRLAVSATYFGL